MMSLGEGGSAARLEITIHLAIHVDSIINLHVAVVSHLILFLHNVKLSKDPVHSPESSFYRFPRLANAER